MGFLFCKLGYLKGFITIIGLSGLVFSMILLMLEKDEHKDVSNRRSRRV